MPYLREQVESIQRQTIQTWKLLIRDDGSSDETMSVARRIADKDDRIILLERDTGSTVGPAQNFSLLVAAGLKTDSNLFFLCDQDDVWEPQKLARQSKAFPKSGVETYPLLVHSDLNVVDENLNPIHPSYIRFMDLDPDPENPLSCLLTRNFITGCSTACNRRLLEDAFPVPREAIMHDWWLAAVAAGIGEIRFIPDSLIQYRQHHNNTIGAKGVWPTIIGVHSWPNVWLKGNSEFRDTFEQAEALYHHALLSNDWPASKMQLLREYRNLSQLSPIKRLFAAKKMGIRRENLLLRLTYYFRLLTIKQDLPEGPEQSL